MTAMCLLRAVLVPPILRVHPPLQHSPRAHLGAVALRNNYFLGKANDPRLPLLLERIARPHL